MNNHIPKIRALHSAIVQSLFHRKPRISYTRTIQAIDLLARLVADYPGESDVIWSIGECTECTVDTLLVAAYWHLAHWHEGQYSDSYRAMCNIGRVFNPGMSGEPRRDDPEFETYKALDAFARRNAGMPVYSFCPIVIAV